MSQNKAALRAKRDSNVAAGLWCEEDIYDFVKKTGMPGKLGGCVYI